MNHLVLDASVTLAWFLDRPISRYAIQVNRDLEGGARAIVPWLWLLEVPNGLLMAHRRGLLSADDADDAIKNVEDLLAGPIAIHATIPAVREVLATARTLQLTCYDAMYVDIARSEGIPLATLDKDLRTAAVRAGVDLFQ